MARRQIDPERRAEIGRERRARTRTKILAAAFDLFGQENGLYASIEDVTDQAGVTRPTFYNHFKDMEDLRQALTYEVTHDFITETAAVIDQLADPREHTSVAIRLYLMRAQRDKCWAWSMINLSANGIIFGAENYRRAEKTIEGGLAAGVFSLRYAALGRDMVLGSALAALSTIIRENPGEDYPALVAMHILEGLGVPADLAKEVANRPLPFTL